MTERIGRRHTPRMEALREWEARKRGTKLSAREWFANLRPLLIAHREAGVPFRNVSEGGES